MRASQLAGGRVSQHWVSSQPVPPQLSSPPCHPAPRGSQGHPTDVPRQSIKALLTQAVDGIYPEAACERWDVGAPVVHCTRVGRFTHTMVKAAYMVGGRATQQPAGGGLVGGEAARGRTSNAHHGGRAYTKQRRSFQ